VKLILDGCTPEPLMCYLKALGVLRLVSEQKDAEALGYWSDGVFVLETSLDHDGLLKLFRDEYEPTPIVSPWNGGSGFYRTWDDTKNAFRNRDAVKQVEFIEQSSLPRLKQYRSVIRVVKEALHEFAREINVRKMSKPERNSTLLISETRGVLDDQYDRLLPFLRSRLPDDALKWFDTVVVLQGGEKRAAPLFISGGNDGNFDFSVTFMDYLQKAFTTPEKSEDWLRSSLFSVAVSQISGGTAGHLHPGSYDGPNSSVGFSGGGGVNPWDFVFMMEGAVLLAGAVSRRQGAGTVDRAIFPFTVSPSAVGYGSAADTDETSDASRAEVWVPLWDQPTACAELIHLFAEGRAQIGRKQARTGIEFARAVAGLGVSRGIAAFTRFGFLRRFGKMFLAAPLGRFAITPHPRIDLLDDLQEWEEGLRRACRDKDKTPSRYLSVLRNIDQAVFTFASRSQADETGERSAILDVLRCLGRAERTISAGAGFRSKNFIKPLGGLSRAWLTAANDLSPEFRLARGLVFLDLGKKGTGSVRRYLEPVEYNPRFRSWGWGEGGGHVVWGDSEIARNLGAVLIRRLMDSEKNGEPFPPLGSPFAVGLAEVAAFIRGEVDEEKLEDLLWGLLLVEREDEWESPSREDGELPRTYALLKLTMLPGKLEWKPVGDRLRLILRPPRNDEKILNSEPAIPAKLRAGDLQGACELATRRLLSSGFSPVGGFLADGTRRTIDWPAGGAQSERLLGALLFPISDHAVDQLADLVLRRPSVETLA
jgi:CRISPR-associated protein Csx17